MELQDVSIKLKELLHPDQVPENATLGTVDQAIRSQSILRSDLRGGTPVLFIYATALIHIHVC